MEESRQAVGTLVEVSDGIATRSCVVERCAPGEFSVTHHEYLGAGSSLRWGASDARASEAYLRANASTG